jgi:hypothetical protein
MSSLYFGLDVFYQFEARISKFDAVFIVHVCTLYGGGVACQIGRIHLTQNTTTTSLC